MKKSTPKTVKKIIRPLLKYPMFYYFRRVLRPQSLYFIRLLNFYPTGYREDKSSLMDNFSRYELLFRDSEKNFETIVAPYTSEFKKFICSIYNGTFESVDAELYYSIIRKYRPDRIIEIGSGHSTLFAINALRVNGKGEIIVIDPGPRRIPPKGIAYIQSKVEEVNVNLFKGLSKNDILFIDSSHTTEEAKYHTEEILPNLKEGVLIHHHDFRYPYAVYYQNEATKFGEPDVLLDYYLENRTLYEIMVCASYVRYKNPDIIKWLLRSYHLYPTRLPGSLWVRKIRS